MLIVHGKFADCRWAARILYSEFFGHVWLTNVEDLNDVWLTSISGSRLLSLFYNGNSATSETERAYIPTSRVYSSHIMDRLSRVGDALFYDSLLIVRGGFDFFIMDVVIRYKSHLLVLISLNTLMGERLVWLMLSADYFCFEGWYSKDFPCEANSEFAKLIILFPNVINR